jgi:hypothetical protein
MATAEEITASIACLSTVFPQYAAKKLAEATDQIVSAIQGFTDPLAALGDINVDSIVDDVATLSEGDVFDNLGAAAVGLTAQYAKREAQDMFGAMGEESSLGKRANDIRNLSSKLIATGSLMMTLFPDMPYAAAQKMCEAIISLCDLKNRNLTCLTRHIVQLVNSIMVLVENVDNYTDDTIDDLQEASNWLFIVKTELTKSQPLVNGAVGFDEKAFERARQAMLNVNGQLTPDKDGTSILDVVDILSAGSVEAAHVTRANRSLVTMVIPSLINLIQQEIVAVEQQVNVINHYVNALTATIDNYRNSGNTSRVAEMRARAIDEIQWKVNELTLRVDLAIERQSTSAASAEMLLWASRVKTILATMNRVKDLTLQEGSIEGPDKAYALELAFQTLLTDIAGINSERAPTVAGIEDTTVLVSQVQAIILGAQRIVGDLEAGRTSEAKIVSFHTLAITVATAQISTIQASQTVATNLKAACQTFADIDLQVRERFDELTDSMRQLGLDRAVDMLNTGAFAEFLDADMDVMSYQGAAISCLTTALDGIDDVQTRQQISDIRDNIVASKANQDIAAADSSDQGRSRFIETVQATIANIQKNTKAVESIVEELQNIADEIGAAVGETVGTATAFLGNVDHLNVGAGGALASILEEYSDHPKAGTPLCGSV